MTETQPDRSMQPGDREAVVDTLTTLFIATDERDWAAVRGVLAPSVHFDMSSAGGGEPAARTPEQITGGWEQGLAAVKAIHHQVGNVRVRIEGSVAQASCYGVAYHWLPNPTGRNSRVFVGSYDFHLTRGGESGWLIDSFRFNLKFVDGNPHLERDAQT